MLGESLQRYAIVLIGTAVFFELASAPTDLAFLTMVGAVLLGLIGVVVDVFSGREVIPEDPRTHTE